jgi:hypothetical protein
MTGFRPPPQRHWRSYGIDPLPSPAEALAEPFAAFPSWFLRITGDRCGKDRMVNEAHATGWRDRPLREILARARHDGCGGQAARVELLTGIEGASSRPVGASCSARDKRPAPMAAHHGFGVSLPVTTKSVRRDRQSEHRNRSAQSGVSPRPAAIRAGRSASARWRQALHQTRTRT